MHSYKVLDKQRFSKDEFSIEPIRYEDSMLILKWRNEQMYHLRQSKPLTEEDQEHYFETTVQQLFNEEKPKQLLFSYFEKQVCIGYGGLVHINWIDKHAEISFIMNTELEKEHFSKHWKTFLKLVEQVGFDELNLHKLFTFAYDLRPHLYAPIEEASYTKEATLKNHIFFNNEYKDVVIHSKFNIYKDNEFEKNSHHHGSQ
jgi:RimJ/RimL family protein N-acetyltransferase